MNRFIKSISLKKYNFTNNLDISVSQFLLVAGSFLLVIQFFKSPIEIFFESFISFGYSAILAPVLLLYLIYNNIFSFKLNFTSKRSFFRHLIESIITTIFLLIILLQINALQDSSSDSNINLINLIYIAIFIPIYEEIIYRFILITILFRKCNIIIRIIISGFLFGLMHFAFSNFYLFILYLICGLILSILYSLENFLFPSFLSHGLANLIIFLIYF